MGEDVADVDDMGEILYYFEVIEAMEGMAVMVIFHILIPIYLNKPSNPATTPAATSYVKH
jgi:hypothetical protein